ncbi:MAG: CSLREA domain-containing protein, partial [Chloroflexota bacterium]
MIAGRITTVAPRVMLLLRARWRLWLLATIIIVALQVVVQVAPAQSLEPTFTVSKLDDGNDGQCDPDDSGTYAGQCTLREAIVAANALNTAATIVLSPTQAVSPPYTYTLSISGGGENQTIKGDLDIAGELTIQGQGADSTVIDGAL